MSLQFRGDKVIEPVHRKSTYHSEQEKRDGQIIHNLSDKYLLSDISCNEPIIVLGGAPGVVEEYESIKSMPHKLMLVNYHFLHLYNPDYLVFLDNPHLGNITDFKREVYSNTSAIRFCLTPSFTDVWLKDTPTRKNSGIFAVWLALQITVGKVYPLGFTHYTGTDSYSEDSMMWDVNPIKPGVKRTNTIELWRETLKNVDLNRLIWSNNELKQLIEQ